MNFSNCIKNAIDLFFFQERAVCARLMECRVNKAIKNKTQEGRMSPHAHHHKSIKRVEIWGMRRKKNILLMCLILNLIQSSGDDERLMKFIGLSTLEDFFSTDFYDANE